MKLIHRTLFILTLALTAWLATSTLRPGDIRSQMQVAGEVGDAEPRGTRGS